MLHKPKVCFFFFSSTRINLKHSNKNQKKNQRVFLNAHFKNHRAKQTTPVNTIRRSRNNIPESVPLFPDLQFCLNFQELQLYFLWNCIYTLKYSVFCCGFYHMESPPKWFKCCITFWHGEQTVNRVPNIKHWTNKRNEKKK